MVVPAVIAVRDALVVTVVVVTLGVVDVEQTGNFVIMLVREK